jgi:hypothetical protein
MPASIAGAFGMDVDYAMLIKHYSAPADFKLHHYSKMWTKPGGQIKPLARIA